MKRFNLVCFCLIAFSSVDKDKVIRNPPTGLIKIIQKDNFPERPDIYQILLAKYILHQIAWQFSLFRFSIIGTLICAVSPCTRSFAICGVCRISQSRVKSELTNKSYRFRKYSSIGQTNNQGITNSRSWVLMFVKKTEAVLIMITMMVMLMKRMEIHSFNYLF